jgi:hypothetical protein
VLEVVRVFLASTPHKTAANPPLKQQSIYRLVVYSSKIPSGKSASGNGGPKTWCEGWRCVNRDVISFPQS